MSNLRLAGNPEIPDLLFLNPSRAIQMFFYGELELSPKTRLIITREADKLMGQGNWGGPKFEMMSQNETTFIHNMGTGQTLFVKDSKRQVTHSILRYPGGQEKIQKKL